jgi:ACS family tartrate transporter-like MFS transporter
MLSASGASAPALLHPDDSAIGISAQRKAALHLLPILGIGYGLALIDRINISFASLRMNSDLHFSATVYGLGAGLFFIGYALCEVPSNLMILRFGARRWMARIMMTWGLLATAMILVRTPWEFYTVRLLLGVAEAGFFPGVIYYLTLWFPVHARARAVSRFYIAAPLSSTVTGALAGWLLGLDGRLGLTGWQWIFLAEGLPPIAFGLFILRFLPDSPADAPWLTAQERFWLTREIEADSAKAHLGDEAGVLQSLLSPKVWMLGFFFLCVLTCTYAFNFSAPAILQGVTGWTAGQVGYLVAIFGCAGAAAMLFGGASSDRTGERVLHCMVPSCVIAAGFFIASYAHPAWLVVIALACSFSATYALQGPALAVPMQLLSGRAAAAGIAAMNSIALFSGFIGPYWMGITKDATGTYWLGLRALMLPALAAAVSMFAIGRSLAKKQPAVRAESLADEVA